MQTYTHTQTNIHTHTHKHLLRLNLPPTVTWIGSQTGLYMAPPTHEWWEREDFSVSNGRGYVRPPHSFISRRLPATVWVKCDTSKATYLLDTCSSWHVQIIQLSPEKHTPHGEGCFMANVAQLSSPCFVCAWTNVNIWLNMFGAPVCFTKRSPCLRYTSWDVCQAHRPFSAR